MSDIKTTINVINVSNGVRRELSIKLQTDDSARSEKAIMLAARHAMRMTAAMEEMCNDSRGLRDIGLSLSEVKSGLFTDADTLLNTVAIGLFTRFLEVLLKKSDKVVVADYTVDGDDVKVIMGGKNEVEVINHGDRLEFRSSVPLKKSKKAEKKRL